MADDLAQWRHDMHNRLDALQAAIKAREVAELKRRAVQDLVFGPESPEQRAFFHAVETEQARKSEQPDAR